MPAPPNENHARLVYIRGLIRQFDEGVTVGEDAIIAMSKIGAPAIPYIKTCLPTTTSAQKSCLAMVLADIGGSNAVTPLLTILDDDDWNARASSVLALRNINDERATLALKACLADKNEYVVRLAIQGLDAAAKPDLVVELDEEVVAPSDSAVMRKIVWGLVGLVGFLALLHQLDRIFPH